MEKKERKPSKKKELPVWAKYMGLSFQLFGVIGVGTWFGWWVQQKSEMKFPLWILVFSFLSIILAFYQLWISMKQDR